MKVEWKEPPATVKGPKGRRFVPDELIAALKKARGRWARIYGPKSYPLASLVRRAQSRDPGLEVVSRKESEGYSLYARYTRNGNRK